MADDTGMEALQEYVENNELVDVSADDEQVPAEAVEAEQSEAEPVEDEAQEAEEVPELADSLEGLAEQIELDVDDLKALKVNVEVDGETRTITIAEALEQVSQSNTVTVQSTQLAESQRIHNEQVQQATSMWQDRLQRIDAAVRALESDMEEAPDLNQYLMEGDTEGYLLEKAKLDQKQQKLQYAQYARQQAQEEERSQREQQALQRRAENGRQLVNLYPELKNPEKAAAFDKEMEAAGIAFGYAPQEISSWMGGDYDWRQVAILKAAYSNKKALEKQPELTKRLKVLPKVRKPGSPKGADEKSRDSRRALEAKIRASKGDYDVAAEAFEIFAQ